MSGVQIPCVVVVTEAHQETIGCRTEGRGTFWRRGAEWTRTCDPLLRRQIPVSICNGA
jgi:hypothetical protein